MIKHQKKGTVMRLKILFAGVILCGFFLQGCNTLKGAGNGFKEDWKTVTQVDDWIQEKMW